MRGGDGFDEHSCQIQVIFPVILYNRIWKSCPPIPARLATRDMRCRSISSLSCWWVAA